MSPRLSDLFLSSQSDERLVSLARAGHERAFAVIVERYRPELHAMARRLCSDGRSEDIVQQALLSAFAALSSGAEVRHLRGWLYQILRNAAGRLQAPTCVPLERAEVESETLEDVVLQRALAMTTLSEMARLPIRQRQAMVATALDGRGRAEIASSMGLSEGAVRQLVHRARASLRGAVTAFTPWPLARWIAGLGPDAPGPAELTAGAGAATSGGLALKLGALLASGTILTGAAVQLHAVSPQRPPTHAVSGLNARSHTARSHALAVGAVPSVEAAVMLPLRSRTSSTAPARGRPLEHAGSVALGIPLRHGHQETTQSRSGPGQDERSDTGHGGAARSDGENGGGGTGKVGGGDSAVPSKHSDGGGQESGRGTGSGSDGGGDGGSRAGTGSDGGGSSVQIASASNTLDAAGEGSGSGHDSNSGDALSSRADSGSGGGNRGGEPSGASGQSSSGEKSGSGGGGTSAD